MRKISSLVVRIGRKKTSLGDEKIPFLCISKPIRHPLNRLIDTHICTPSSTIGLNTDFSTAHCNCGLRKVQKIKGSPPHGINFAPESFWGGNKISSNRNRKNANGPLCIVRGTTTLQSFGVIKPHQLASKPQPGAIPVNNPPVGGGRYFRRSRSSGFRVLFVVGLSAAIKICLSQKKTF